MIYVGDALAKKISRLGITPRPQCNCKKYQQMMNNYGPSWVEQNVDTVCGWLQSEASKRKLPAPKIFVKRLVMSAVKEAKKVDLKSYFDKVYCVNLERRADRWEQFLSGVPSDWPFAKIERWNAVDGSKVPPPAWWRQGKGGWGCYRSHHQIIEKCLNEGVDRVLILEDDAIFSDDFTATISESIAETPAGWGMMYLGGQHLHASQRTPKRANDYWCYPWNVNRTHAFALQGNFKRTVYEHLSNTTNWQKKHHVDHHLGILHQRSHGKVIALNRFKVGQRENRSDIANKSFPTRFWNSDASAYRPAKSVADNEVFVPILGLHSSGSSCLAGCLWHTNQVYMGKTLVGYYGTTPGKDCGYEALGMARILQSANKGWDAQMSRKRELLWHQVKQWIDQKKGEAARQGMIAAVKHPLLCGVPDQLTNSKSKLKLVISERPIEDSIKSIVKRQPNVDPVLLDRHQRWLQQGKELLKSRHDHVSVDYYDLLEDPIKSLEPVFEFLDLEVAKDVLNKIKTHVQKKMRHV